MLLLDGSLSDEVKLMSDANTQLPWPVQNGKNCLVATHWPPDYDGLASAVGWLGAVNKCSSIGVAKLFIPTPLPDRFDWILSDIDTHIDKEFGIYDSCIILDTSPVSDRTRLPHEWLIHLEHCEQLYSVDHHMDDNHPFKLGNRHLVCNVPSTACILLDNGIYHPYFFSSIWTDTRRLTLRVKESIRYLQKLYDYGLTESEVESQLALLEPKRPMLLLQDLLDKTHLVDTWELLNGCRVVVCCATDSQHVDAIHEIRELLRYYADIAVVIDIREGRVSLWAREGLGVRLNDFAESVLRGGGHASMAGGPLGSLTPDEIVEHLKEHLNRL